MHQDTSYAHAILLWGSERRSGIDWIFEELTEQPGSRELEAIQCLKGLILQSSATLLSQTLADVRDLRAGQPVQQSRVFALLPEEFEDSYDVAFGYRFTHAMLQVASKLMIKWNLLNCVAEEIALDLILDHVDEQSEVWNVQLWAGWRADLQDVLYEDLDFYDLFVGGPLQAKPADWFEPFRPGLS